MDNYLFVDNHIAPKANTTKAPHWRALAVSDPDPFTLKGEAMVAVPDASDQAGPLWPPSPP